MEAWLRVFLLMPGPAWRRCLGGLPILLLAGVLQAQEVPVAPGNESVIQPEIERTEVDLAAIDTEDFEIALVLGSLSIEDFGVQSLLGLRLAYHVTPDFFAEFAYGQADAGLTSFERVDSVVRLLSESERRFQYYEISLGYNLLPGEAFLGANRAYNSALYLIGGIGATEFAGSDRFTVSYGFGYRLLANDWLALHLGVRDHLLDLDVLAEERTTHNLEMTAAVSIFF